MGERLRRAAPRRGLRKPEAAAYVGVSETAFSRLVEAGKMPQGFMVGGIRLWDVYDLEPAFDALKEQPRSNVIPITDRL